MSTHIKNDLKFNFFFFEKYFNFAMWKDVSETQIHLLKYIY